MWQLVSHLVRLTESLVVLDEGDRLTEDFRNVSPIHFVDDKDVSGGICFRVGTLFVATTMGMEVTGDIQSYAMLRAIGLSTPTIVLLVTLQTMTVTALGGIVGTLLGYGGIYLSNTLAQQWLTSGPIAAYEPLLIPYGFGIALLTGVLAVPYLSWLATRGDTLTHLEA